MIKIIGPHTLYLGNAYQLLPTLGWFDAIVTDPPYLFNNSGGGKWRKDRGASDRMIEQGLCNGFDHVAIINPLLCGQVVVFCHNDQTGPLKVWLDGTFHRVATLHWLKTNPAPHRNKHYLADKEDWFHAWNKGWHPVGDHHDMHRYVMSPVQAERTWGHPTVKPDAVMDKIMSNVNGNTICDPFMGTGSTGVAALRAGKVFTGIEHNPAHFATAIKRFEAAWADQQQKETAA